MKKCIAVFLILALCCMLLPAVGEDASVVGTWYIADAFAEGADVLVADPEAITLTLNGDGTFSLATGAFSAGQTGTWTAEDGVLKLDAGNDNVSEFRIDGEWLVFEMGATPVRMGRTPAATVELPAAAAAETAGDFDGTWVPRAQLAYGLYSVLPAENAASVATVIIEDGKIGTYLPDSEGKLQQYGSYEATLEDGALKCTDDNGYSVTDMTLTLREDGSMFFNSLWRMTEEAALDLTYVYVREDAAEESPAA